MIFRAIKQDKTAFLVPLPLPGKPFSRQVFEVFRGSPIRPSQTFPPYIPCTDRVTCRSLAQFIRKSCRHPLPFFISCGLFSFFKLKDGLPGFPVVKNPRSFHYTFFSGLVSTCSLLTGLISLLFFPFFFPSIRAASLFQKAHEAEWSGRPHTVFERDP